MQAHCWINVLISFYLYLILRLSQMINPWAQREKSTLLRFEDMPRAETGTWEKGLTIYVTLGTTSGFTSHLSEIQSNSKKKKKNQTQNWQILSLSLGKIQRKKKKKVGVGGKWGTCICWPELHDGVVFLRSGWSPGSLPVFQCHFAAAAEPAWPHSLPSSPSSPRDSLRDCCTFQHPPSFLGWWFCTANRRCRQHLQAFPFPWDLAAPPPVKAEPALPLPRCQLQKERAPEAGSFKKKKKKSYLKGQESFAGCLSS